MVPTAGSRPVRAWAKKQSHDFWAQALRRLAGLGVLILLRMSFIYTAGRSDKQFEEKNRRVGNGSCDWAPYDEGSGSGVTAGPGR